MIPGEQGTPDGQGTAGRWQDPDLRPHRRKFPKPKLPTKVVLRLIFLRLSEVVGFTFCNPMASGKGLLEDEQLSGLLCLGGAWGVLGPLADLPEHSVRYTLFGLSS